MPKIPKQGARAAVLAPASPLKSRAEINDALELVSSLGFEPVPFPSLYEELDYLAGTDELRAADLTNAFSDPTIEIIFCLRGGYGSARLLPHLDLEKMASSEKMFCGFSDLTSIANALLLHGLGSIHSPTLSYFLQKDEKRNSSLDALRQAIIGNYNHLDGNIDFKCISKEGRAEGIIVGGNLTVFCTLIGTPWMPESKGSILFIEDLNEKPYKIDRSITHLRNCRWLENITGIIIGDFTDCDAGKPDRDSAMDVLKRCLAPISIPILAGIPAGHGTPSLPIPMGARLQIDSNHGRIKLLG